MIYNHMPEWIYSIKDLSPSSKLIMERIFSLSKDGHQHVFFNREKFSVILGISVRQVGRCLKELEDLSLIETVKNSNPFDRTKTFKITKKTLSKSECQKVSLEQDNMSLSNGSVLVNDEDIGVPLEQDNMSFSSSDRSFSKNRESVEGENTHSPSSNSFVFSVQTAEEILSKTSDELNVSLSETKLHSEAVKFFEYYSDKKLSTGQIKVKARTWIDNCKKYPDFKNKKSYDTAAKEGFIGILREECEKEEREQEKGLKPKEQNCNLLMVTDFYEAMKKNGHSNSIFEYPDK